MARLRTLVLLSLVALQSSAADAGAATACPYDSRGGGACLQIVDNSNWDYNGNYDFGSERWAYNNVDWADAVFFYNHASAVKVASIVGEKYTFNTHSQMFGYSDEQEVNEISKFAPSRGSQTDAIGCVTSGDHVRTYGGQRGYMYNVKFGYFVWATMHYDQDQGCPGGFSGYSENAENVFANWLRSKGYQVADDWAWLDNNEPFRQEGNHVWESNGYATYVFIPE